MRVKDLAAARRGDHSRGLSAAVGRELHPVQEAWPDIGVAPCSSCGPGRSMTAEAAARRADAAGREIDGADAARIRNIRRCGTYNRIREASREGAGRVG
ncbi:2Fe-2S iron-sulfur cluster-binding protein [Streptomyces sp. NPDC048018]|uniref:2Fe-2S iron-sulfur cluster-binding protein n=1 Tax=Streptomyces sp. NPDC048018 TaxID=3365499 RepID=UPI00371AEB6F